MSMPMLEGKDADQIDQKSQHADDKESLVLHLGRLENPLNSFGKDEESDEEEEEPVHEPSQHFGSDIAEAKLVIRSPLGYHL